MHAARASRHDCCTGTTDSNQRRPWQTQQGCGTYTVAVALSGSSAHRASMI